MFKNFRFSKALALVCLSGLVLSCERKMDESTKLNIQLPHTSANQMYSKSGISAQTVGGGASWGVADPSVFDDISCFAIAVEAPDLNQYKCKRSDGTIAFRPGVLVGAFPAGDRIEIDVPAGPDRRIHAIGFAATSLSACTNFDVGGGPDKTNLSAPHMLGSVKKDLEPGNSTVVINASLSAAGKFHDCDKPNFGDQPDNGGQPNLFVPDVSISEGATFDLMFYLDAPASQDVVFSVSFSGNTAIYPTDVTSFFGNPFTATIPTGSVSLIAPISSVDDASVEGNETFSYTMFNVTGANTPAPTGLGTILDNDSGGGVPNLFVNPNGTTEGGAPSLTVWLDGPPATDVTFFFSTYDGNAVSPTDYSAVSGGVTIPSGNTITSIGFSTVQDTVYEGPDEVFYVSLSSVAGATVVSDFGAITISEDDSVPAIYVSDDTVVEGGTLHFMVSLSNPGVNPVGFNWNTLDGTATISGDYFSVSNSVTIAPGSLGATLMVTTIDDGVGESPEVMYVTLSSPTSGVIGDGYALGNINDNDSGTPNLYVMDSVVTEGSPFSFDFVLDSAPATDITISFNVSSGTAFASGTDFSGAPGGYAVTIGSGVTIGSHVISTIQDSADEDNETMTVSVTSAPLTSIVDGLAIGTINDDDAAPLIYVDDSVAATEGADLLFVVSLNLFSGRDISFVWTTHDMSTQGGADYTVTSQVVTIPAGDWLLGLTVPTVGDSNPESTEIVMVSLSSLTNVIAADDSGTGTILDDDVPTLSISDASGTEGQTLSFLVTMSSTIGSNVTFEYYTSDNTAASPTDFGGISFPMTATIAAGLASFYIDIPTVDDGTGESTEFFDIYLQSLSGATALDAVGLGTILDNDAGASLFVLDTSVTEGGTADVMFSLSAVSGSNVDISFSTHDSSAFGAGTDYFGGSFSVQIPAGQTFATFGIDTNDDALNEGPEVFMVSITSASNATIAAPGVDDTAVITINDNDVIPGMWMGTPISVVEGQSAAVDVVLDAPSASNITVNFFTSDGTAISGSGDYVTRTETITFPAGVTIAFMPITTNDDAFNEFDEFFNVSLSGLGGASLIGSGFAAISIMDNDPEPSLHIHDSTHLEGSTLQFMISMSQISGRDISFNVATVDGTATQVSLSDYVGNSFPMTIPAGALTAGIQVSTSDDTIFEPVEDFTVTLTSLLNLNVSLSNTGAKGIIRDNDGWGTHPKIVAPNADATDKLGNAVAVDGGLFVVAAYFEDSNQTTVSQGVGGSADNSVNSSGAVYAYRKIGSSWQQVAYLKPDYTEVNDSFGSAVDVDGNVVAVAVQGDDSNQTTVTPSGSADNSASNAGAVYVFRDQGGTWFQEAYLKPSHMDANDVFGYQIAASADKIAVSSKGESSNQTTISYGPSSGNADNTSASSGAVYVFQYSGGSWTQDAMIKASNSETNDYFGSSVDLFGGLLVVGAEGEDSNQTVITNGAGASGDNSLSSSGAAYIYRHGPGGSWFQEAYLKASNADLNDKFGAKVAAFEGLVAVSATQEGSSQSFVTNGGTSSGDNTLGTSGAVYVYENNGGTWMQEAYLKPSSPGGGDKFGSSLDVTHKTVVVGVNLEDSGAAGIDYGPYAAGDDSSMSAGAVYVFSKMGGSWAQANYMKAPVNAAGDQFGSDVSIDGDLLVVGALGDDTGATDAGAAYVYNWRGPITAIITRDPAQNPVTASHPMNFNVRFSRPISAGSFVVGDLVNSGTATGVTWNIINSGDNMNFTIQATGGTTASAETYRPSIGAGMVQDPEGQTNTASVPMGPTEVTVP